MPPAEKIRVMIVDDVSETRENVRKLLQFESDVDVVGVARTGKEAIQLSLDLNPDVVLMDINMPDMDGISATEAIRSKQPAVQVVILSVQGDQNYMRRAMLAGARDFLTKPPMGDELISAIRRAGSMAQSERTKNAQVQVAPAIGNVGTMIGYSATRGKNCNDL
jgi:pilus assembly protein CpaE